MKNIKITVGTCAYLSHAFKYVCSQYGVTSCQGEHKMKIRSLSVLVAMILLIGCYSPVAKVDAAEKNYKKEYLPKDIFSGIIMAAVSIPISMGYAQIAHII